MTVAMLMYNTVVVAERSAPLDLRRKAS